jgi:uncharacterized protein YcgL (UPF0745 family)
MSYHLNISNTQEKKKKKIQNKVVASLEEASQKSGYYGQFVFPSSSFLNNHIEVLDYFFFPDLFNF